MDTIKEKVDSLEKRMEKVESNIDDFKDNQVSFERRIEEKIDNKLTAYSAETRMMIEKSDAKSRNRGQKLFSQTEKIGETLGEINSKLVRISTDLKHNTEDIEKMEESDKWKTRTIAGFVIAILLMVVGTLWDLLVGFPF